MLFGDFILPRTYFFCAELEGLVAKVTILCVIFEKQAYKTVAKKALLYSHVQSIKTYLGPC